MDFTLLDRSEMQLQLEFLSNQYLTRFGSEIKLWSKEVG